MKNLSKVLAVVLAFAMALSMVSFAAYSDVEAGSDCEEAVTVLSALGIISGYTDGTFKPEATITRAEFASVVIRMLGYGDIAGGGSVVFDDVPADHWANGVIALAASQGIIAGYGNGNFGPEDPVNYEQAIAMVVRALGYTPMADANGGYPGGFQIVAASKGILAGTTGAPGTPAPRGTVAQFVYNALTVPMMEQVTFGGEAEYKPVKKLLLNNHGVTKFEGVVDKTSASSSSVKAGKIVVDYKNQISAPTNNAALAVKYPSANANAYPYVQNFDDVTIKATGELEVAAKELIDILSVMYVKNAETSDAELLCIMKDGDKNKTVEFMAEDLRANAALDSSAEGVLEVYTDKDAGDYEEYEVDITKVYVNGRQNSIATASGVTAAELINTDAEFETIVEYYLQTGKPVDVKLLANDPTNEEVYTVAYITVWEDAVVESVSARNWKVYTNNGTYTLDETDVKNQNFTIYKDGKVASFEDIKENDVLSVAGYKDGSVLKYGDVYITSEQLEGKVTGTVSGSSKVYVDGAEYKMNATVAGQIKLGNSYVFYKNARGVLVGLDRTESKANLKYGYGAWIYSDINFSEASLRVLTADGVWTTLEIADKFTTHIPASPYVNDLTESTVDWSTDVAGIAGQIGTSDKYAINGVIAYELNDAGEVDVLYLTNWNNASSEFVNTGINASAGTAKDKQYVAATGLLGGHEVDDSTVIFSLASGYTTGANNTDEDKVSVVSVSTLIDRDSYNIMGGFNADSDTNVWPVLYGYEFTAGIDWTSDFFVVTADPIQTTNDAGDKGVAVKGLVKGEEVSIFFNQRDLVAGDVEKIGTDYDTYAAALNGPSANYTDIAINALATDIAKGDVLIYNLNAKNEVAKAIILVDASDVVRGSADATFGWLNDNADANTASVLGNFTASTNTYSFVYGYAIKKDNNRLTLVNGASDATPTVYRFEADTVGAIYDAFRATGRVDEAVYGDATLDLKYDTAEATKDGDFIFARVSNGVVVDDFVIFHNKD